MKLIFYKIVVLLLIFAVFTTSQPVFANAIEDNLDPFSTMYDSEILVQQELINREHVINIEVENLIHQLSKSSNTSDDMDLHR